MLGAVLVVLGLGTLVGWIPEQPGGVQGKIFSLLVAAGGLLGPWLFAFRPRILLDDVTVTVINPLRRVVVPLTAVRPKSAAEYAGLRIDYLEGSRVKHVVAWAVQKWNLASWLGLHTRADLVAETIANAAAVAQGGPIPRAHGAVE